MDKQKTNDEQNEELQRPVTQEEVFEALKQGKSSKTPGTDGLPHEF